MRVLRFWRLGRGAARFRTVGVRTIGVCAIGVCAIGVGAALAQPVPSFPECTTKPTPQDNESAKNAHKVATQFYDRADYDKAIQYWNDAFKFDCTVNDLLINIANAYEKKGDRAATVATLEAYLKRTGPNPIIEAKVKNLKAAMAPAPTASSAPTAPTVVPSATAAPSVTAAATAAPTAPPEGPRPYGYKPWGLVGGGGALVLIGVILLPIGYGKLNDASSKCPDHLCQGNQSITDEGNQGRSLGAAGWGLFGTGLAAAAGGLVWQIVYNKPGPAPSTPPGKVGTRGLWMTPTTGGRGQSGVVMGGSF